MIIFVFLLAYLLGSLPFGYWIAKVVRNVDIRKFGSGNIGATNVARVIGKKWGILVFFLDFIKGFLAIYLTLLIYPSSQEGIYLISAILVVCGHSFSIFLKFKGGKGVSTSLGAICGLIFKYFFLLFPLLIALLVWGVVFFRFHFISLASLLASFSFFVSTLFFRLPYGIKSFSFLIFVLILLRHRSNILRLMKRREFRL